MVYENYWRAKRTDLLPSHERWRKQANLAKLSPEGRLRLEWIIHAELCGNVAKTCRHFGIGSSVFYKWKKVFDPSHIQSLQSRSRAPANRRGRRGISYMDMRVVKLRKKYPYFGKMKIACIYRNTYGQDITSWYVQRVIEEYGLYFIKKKRHWTQNKNSIVKKRITEFKEKPATTGFLIHLDTVELRVQGVKRYVITAIDHYSKITYVRVYKNHTSATAKDFFEKLYYLLDNKIKHVHTDNGSEFHKYFEQALKKLNLTHWWSRSHTPKDNPANERFNRTFREEFLQWGHFNKDIDKFNKNITEWLVEYNFVRPHESLNYLTPMQYAEKANKLSTMWSSCTGS